MVHKVERVDSLGHFWNSFSKAIAVSISSHTLLGNYAPSSRCLHRDFLCLRRRLPRLCLPLGFWGKKKRVTKWISSSFWAKKIIRYSRMWQTATYWFSPSHFSAILYFPSSKNSFLGHLLALWSLDKNIIKILAGKFEDKVRNVSTFHFPDFEREKCENVERILHLKFLSGFNHLLSRGSKYLY